MLVMRTDLSGNPSFPRVVERVKQMTLGAYQHQDVPFEQIIEMFQPQRSLNRSPLYQIEFTLQNAPLEPLEVRAFAVRPTRRAAGVVGNRSQLDDDRRAEMALLVDVIYSTDLFDGETVERMMGHFQNLLRGDY